VEEIIAVVLRDNLKCHCKEELTASEEESKASTNASDVGGGDIGEEVLGLGYGPLTCFEALKIVGLVRGATTSCLPLFDREVVKHWGRIQKQGRAQTIVFPPMEVELEEDN
jgi:hypothetical protein